MVGLELLARALQDCEAVLVGVEWRSGVVRGWVVWSTGD